MPKPNHHYLPHLGLPGILGNFKIIRVRCCPSAPQGGYQDSQEISKLHDSLAANLAPRGSSRVPREISVFRIGKLALGAALRLPKDLEEFEKEKIPKLPPSSPGGSQESRGISKLKLPLRTHRRLPRISRSFKIIESVSCPPPPVASQTNHEEFQNNKIPKLPLGAPTGLPKISRNFKIIRFISCRPLRTLWRKYSTII